MGKMAELSLIMRSSMAARFNARTTVKDIATEFNVPRCVVNCALSHIIGLKVIMTLTKVNLT